MLINREVFSLPPYISTSWSHVTALFMQGETLVVTLSDGTTIKVPHLTAEVIEKVFVTHAGYLEEQAHKGHDVAESEVLTQILEMPFRISLSHLDGLTSALQHNPEHAQTPDLPEEMLQKIGAIAKLTGMSDPQQLPKPEPHCNCAHCQIARAIQKAALEGEEVGVESSISRLSPTVVPSTPLGRDTDASLEIENLWLVEQCDEHVYNVINRDNPNDSYKVYLGNDQVGCNCGKHGCEHILAVLRS